MADNVVANAGAGGSTFRTDDIGGIQWPLTKMAFGVDGAATMVSASANEGLPVQPSASAVFTVAQATAADFNCTEASAAAIKAAVELLDDAVATVAAAVPTKGIAATGTDGTNARILKTDAAGELQIDVLTLPNVTIGAAIPAGTNNIGDVDVASIAAGDNNIGNVDLASAIPAGTNVIGYMGLEPRTSGGLSVARLISAASTNSTNVKASAGQLYNLCVINVGSTVRYLKLYNKATAPTVGTDTPVITLPIPASTNGNGFEFSVPHGIAFSLGIGYGITSGPADNNADAINANEVFLMIAYK